MLTWWNNRMMKERSTSVQGTRGAAPHSIVSLAAGLARLSTDGFIHSLVLLPSTTIFNSVIEASPAQFSWIPLTVSTQSEALHHSILVSRLKDSFLKWMLYLLLTYHNRSKLKYPIRNNHHHSSRQGKLLRDDGGPTLTLSNKITAAFCHHQREDVMLLAAFSSIIASAVILPLAPPIISVNLN